MQTTWMRRTGMMGVAVLAAAALGRTARAEDANTAGIRKALEARYAGVTRAFQNKDIHSLMAVTTADFRVMQPNGAVENRAQIEADYKGQMRAMHLLSWTRHIEKLDVDRNVAVATVRGHFHGIMMEPRGKSHDFALNALAVDTWVKTRSGWKIRLTDVINTKVSIDGKMMERPAGSSRR